MLSCPDDMRLTDVKAGASALAHLPHPQERPGCTSVYSQIKAVVKGRRHGWLDMSWDDFG